MILTYCYTVGEVEYEIDSSKYTMGHLISIEDEKPSNIESIPIDEESELLPKGYFKGMVPTDQRTEETGKSSESFLSPNFRQIIHLIKFISQSLNFFVGNEGTNMERWYAAAALVLWPIGARWNIRVLAGIDNAISELAAMIHAGSPARDAHEYATAIISAWKRKNALEKMASILLQLGVQVCSCLSCIPSSHSTIR